MCGICGLIDFNKNTDQTVLEKMNRTLEHRGPDGTGCRHFKSGNAIVGLGHRRLSIIDLTEGGSQPQSFNSLHITFNGEIYNFAAIKRQLEDKGHKFLSHSDTEVILHAYAEWGGKALQRFIGMFAFVIYDEKNQKLFAARDRAGIKPFFYYWNDGLFLFGSELKALVKHPEFNKEISMDAVAAYLRYGYVPTPHCVYKGCNKLTAGHFLEFDLSCKKIHIEQYWNVYNSYNQPPLKISFPEAVMETEKLLTNAFKYRMVSDVPVGVFLSGGYDSSCVTALLQKNLAEKIKTFTIGMPDLGLDEAPYAKEIASYLGTDHTEFYCTEKEAIEIIPKLPYYYDEPFADNSAIPTMLVSRIAREKVTVALSADGGDEIFAGYSRYDYEHKYGNKLQSIPPFLRKSLASIMELIPARNFPVPDRWYYIYGRYERLKLIIKNPTEKNILESLMQQFNENEIIDLFKPEVKRLTTAFDSTELMNENYSVLASMMAIDYQTYLADAILTKVDRATMSVGLEGREPFLDQRIIEWAAQLPMEYKYNNGNKKRILKEIVHQYIPQKMMDRPKRGFGIPINYWLQRDLKPFVDQFLDEKYIIDQNIFNVQKIHFIKKSFYQGKMEWTTKIWYLLMFQLWHNKWIYNND
jgi:asparagine synthase (glutamine-hydrolysing)